MLDQILIVAVKEPFSDDIALISALSFVSALLMVPAGRSAYFTLVRYSSVTAITHFKKMSRKSIAKKLLFDQKPELFSKEQRAANLGFFEADCQKNKRRLKLFHFCGPSGPAGLPHAGDA